MVKVISLSNEAYNRLKMIKGNKSFSETILENLDNKKNKNIMSLFGCAKEDKEFINNLKQAYKERKNTKLRIY